MPFGVLSSDLLSQPHWSPQAKLPKWFQNLWIKSKKKGYQFIFLPEWVAVCLLESSLQARVAFGIDIIIEFRRGRGADGISSLGNFVLNDILLSDDLPMGFTSASNFKNCCYM